MKTRGTSGGRLKAAERIIVDLALIYDPRSKRDLKALVIAARKWVRKN